MKLFKYGLFIAMGMLLSCRFNPSNENKIKMGYNAELATKLKADQYGMCKYVMAFLKRGPVRNQDSITAVNLQKAHLENIERLAEKGKLVLAGPFFDDGEIRGIYIFDVETIEEAQTLTQTDPAIKAGRLVMELHPWYGSAALKQINELHKTLQKQNVSEQ
ncbi:YciI family protein [Marinifilum fragile]|uniref:YciI family protein n=1 Tax=Marinifilum fragile TaxID=570161 RepID=UPI002AA67E5E|nr:YciI family protein [Marinifilum fragile]